MDTIYIIKKNGKEEFFEEQKIFDAILKAAERGLKEKELNYVDRVHNIAQDVTNVVKSKKKETITTAEIHELVLNELFGSWKEVYDSYSIYRSYRKDLAETYERTHQEAEGIIYAGDKENANKDSTLNSTKHSLIGESVMKTYMRKYELKNEWTEAHDEGWIHIHDLGSRFLRQINCQLFDMANLLRGGFEINGAKTKEPKRFDSAINIVGDVILTASANQFGGFSVGEPLDEILAPYAEKSYQKYIKDFTKELGHLKNFVSNDIFISTIEKMAENKTKEDIKEGVQGLEVKLNTINNALAQIPFTTISIGLDQSKWGREIAKAILEVREAGMANGVTAVFPKIIFLYKDEINGNIDSPNHDIFDLAIKCSSKRLYPDYLSLNTGGFIGDTFDRSGKAIVSMGCRSYLSKWQHPESGEEIYAGRANIGVVSLNTTKMALEAKGDWNKFYELVDKYSSIAFDIHEDYKIKLKKTKGSANPLTFSEGGSWKKVGYDEEIGDIVDAFTASLGFVGIEETLNAMGVVGRGLKKTKAIEITNHLRELCDKKRDETGTLHSLYSTPAESLIYRFMNINKEQYGEGIPGVTDREYLTNSWHYPVWKDISVIDKLQYEEDFHEIASGGHISVAEFVYGVDHSVLKQAVQFAMSKPSMYFGVNVVSTTCNDCGHCGDFREACDKCHGTNLTEVNRTCGYLSYGQIKGETRYNPGKQAEILERVKHN